MLGHKQAQEPSVRADYVRGDPEEDGPITRGRLELVPGGLLFSGPDGPDLRIELERLEGLTVSGRSPYEHPRRHARGTMLVAARRNGSVDVWEFAVEREAGATLRDSIHRELYTRGLRRPPLPFVEQLVGPVGPPEEPLTKKNEHARKNGHDGEPADASPPPPRPLLWRLRFAIVAFAITAVIAAEVLVALSLLR
jgi:hypothetical protein